MAALMTKISVSGCASIFTTCTIYRVTVRSRGLLASGTSGALPLHGPAPQFHHAFTVLLIR
jgi:hypothetical protein